MRIVRVICFNHKSEMLMVEPLKRLGVFELPGGKVKRSETDIAGIIRESFEEVGIEIIEDNLREIYRLVDYDFLCTNRIHYAMTCYVNTQVVTVEPKSTKNNEIRTIAWFEPQKICSGNVDYRSKRFALRYWRSLKKYCPHS